jgi:hypothetical protein
MWAAITHGHHTPLIFIRKCTPEERTSNRDKFCMNTTRYATEVLEPYLVPFLHSLPAHPEDYQTVEDGLWGHTAKLCQEHRKA